MISLKHAFKKLKQIDLKFLLILFFGTFLRILSMLIVPNAQDSNGYIVGAEELLNGMYTYYRPPVFPILVVPFLYFTNNPILAVKLTSFTCGILLIISSYFVFKRASLKIFKGEGADVKANNVALGVSFFVAFNYYLIYTNGRGLREEAVALLFILNFYYIFIKENKLNVRTIATISILLVLLTLIHVSTGLFFYISMVAYFIGTKINLFKDSYSNIKFIIISIAFSFAYGFWLVFSFLRFGDPFDTMTRKKIWFVNNTELDLFTFEGTIEGILNGLEYGFYLEIYELTFHVGFIFILVAILSILILHCYSQIKFLAILLMVNFLLISIFFAATPNIRLIVYFFPFIFYLGFLCISEILYYREELIIGKIYLFKTNIKIKVKYLFTLYLVFFLINPVFIFGAKIYGLDFLISIGNRASFLSEIILFITIIMALLPPIFKKLGFEIIERKNSF